MIYLIIFYLIGFVIVWIVDRKSSIYDNKTYGDLIKRSIMSTGSWITISLFVLFVMIPIYSEKELPKWMKKL